MLVKLMNLGHSSLSQGQNGENLLVCHQPQLWVPLEEDCRISASPFPPLAAARPSFSVKTALDPS